MLLAINANNTNVKFAMFDGETKAGEWRISTDSARTADEYAVWLTQLMANDSLKPASVTACIVAIVVPQALFELRLLCEKYFSCQALVIGEAGVDLGIQALIDQPSEAGADRLVNAVAGHTHYGGPLIIVDFGTGTTFDVVDEQGNYIGGVIAPGINLSIEALYMAAAKLPRIAIENPGQVIGKTTSTAMKSGVFWGYIGLIEGLIARILREHGRADMKVIATGGLASLFDGATDVFDAVDPDLTMKGLVEIYGRNHS